MKVTEPRAHESAPLLLVEYYSGFGVARIFVMGGTRWAYLFELIPVEGEKPRNAFHLIVRFVFFLLMFFSGIRILMMIRPNEAEALLTFR